MWPLELKSSPDIYNIYIYISPKTKLFQIGFPKKHQADPMLEEHLPALGNGVQCVYTVFKENWKLSDQVHLLP